MASSKAQGSDELAFSVKQQAELRDREVKIKERESGVTTLTTQYRGYFLM
jgi:hypothetical protein